MLKNLQLLFALTLLIPDANAQFGPAGIGNSTSNLVWLRSEDLTGLSDGDDISTWSDFSGNSNDFTQPVPTFTPEYQSAVVNGLPVVRFNKTNGRLRKTLFTTFPTTAITAIYVNKNNGESGDGVLSYTSPGVDNDFLLYSSNNLNVYRGSNRASGVAVNDNNWHIVNVTWNNAAGNLEVWKDGNQNHSSTGFRTGTSISTGGCLALAGEQDSPDGSYVAGQAHFGDFTEVIYYNYNLNFAENVIMSNYLAAKYGQTLTANDLYDEDNPANGNFDFEVAGIGRVNALTLHDDSQGSAIVRILNPSNLGDNEYMIWGHNGGEQQASNFTDIPVGVDARFERVWRVSEVNSSGTAIDVGAIDMRWDLNSLLPIVTSDLRLLIDEDNDGFFNDETPIAGATHLGGNIYEFAGVTEITNNRRFTLATINRFDTPLPIDLIDFTAQKIGQKSVQLNWTTASEINNALFQIEKSTDNNSWNVISEIAGAGNSSHEKNYATNDLTPSNGLNYYRIKQIDFDGSFTISQTIALDFWNSENTIRVYPNPTSQLITIAFNSEEVTPIQIFNSAGQEIGLDYLNPTYHSKQLLLDFTNFPNDVYFFKTATETIRIIKQ